MEVDSLVKTTLGEIEKLLSSKAVVGEPITIGEVTLVPLISFGFGFGVGGASGKGEEKRKGEGEGGGTAGGAWVKAVAVIIIDKDGARIEAVKGGISSTLEKLSETVPRVIEKGIDKVAEKWPGGNKEG
jgi:uncharacterized spore protein YtfJ